jgi:EpsI family protein
MTRLAWIFGLLVWAIVACWPSAAFLGKQWTDIDHAHGYLVAAAAFWLIYLDRRAIAAAPARVSIPAFLALLVASIAWAISWRAGLQALHLVLVPVMMGLAVYAAFGFAVAWRLAFPLAYLYLGLPVWEIFNDSLQWLTVQVTELALHLFGIPVRVEGNFVHLNEGIFEVANGCSGLHFFIVGLALSSLLGELEKQSVFRRAGLIALMAALSIIANWIRVIVIVVAGYATHMHHYLVRNHTGFGWLVFTVIVALFLWISRKMLSAPSAKTTPAPELSRQSPQPLPYAAAALVLAIPLVASVITTARERRPESAIAVQLPEGSGTWHRASLGSATTWRPVFKGDSARSYVTYDDGQGHRVEAFGVVYQIQRQGAELVGYDNSLLGTLQTEAATHVVNSPAGPFQELETVDARGSRSLVWYAYEIAGRVFANPLPSQLWYGATSILTERPSTLFAFRARCSVGCESARDTLMRFAADMTPAVRTALITPLPDGVAPALSGKSQPELASSTGPQPVELLKQGLDALHQGDLARAESALLAAHDGDPTALNSEQRAFLLANLVEVRLAQGKTRDAQAAYEDLARLAPGALPTRVLAAEMEMANGNVAAGVAGLQRLILARPDYMPARLLLARGLLSQGNVYQAEAQLNTVLQAAPDHPGAKALLDEVHRRVTGAKGGGTSAAPATAGAAGAAAPPSQAQTVARNAARLNNDAWSYFQRGDFRAELLAKQAYQLAPDRPEVADTYGWILLRMRRDHERALPLLQAAAKGAPRDPEIQYHYASALAASGRRVEAGSILQALLGSGTAFASRAEAQSLFQSVAGQGP